MLENRSSLSVLFVDDEEVIRTNYAQFLSLLFPTVYTAADGEEAYKLYEEYKPNIIIVDINLPKMNGLELLKKIDIQTQSAQAIVMSAHTDIEHQLKEYNLEGVHYLVKPVTRKLFRSTLDEVVSKLEV